MDKPNMANLFWKSTAGTKRLLSTPFKTEEEFEKSVFETSALLEDIFPLKRQIRHGGKTGIPDIVAIDSDGNVCIIEMKNVAVDASIIPQVLQYAIWAETNPDSIKNLWLECTNRPEDLAVAWDSFQVRIIIVAPLVGDVDQDPRQELQRVGGLGAGGGALGLVGAVGHLPRGAVIRQPLERHGIPCAVAREALRKRPIVLGDPNGRVDMKPRVRPREHPGSLVVVEELAAHEEPEHGAAEGLGQPRGVVRGPRHERHGRTGRTVPLRTVGFQCWENRSQHSLAPLAPAG